MLSCIQFSIAYNIFLYVALNPTSHSSLVQILSFTKFRVWAYSTSSIISNISPAAAAEASWARNPVAGSTPSQLHKIPILHNVKYHFKDYLFFTINPETAAEPSNWAMEYLRGVDRSGQRSEIRWNAYLIKACETERVLIGMVYIYCDCWN